MKNRYWNILVILLLTVAMACNPVQQGNAPEEELYSVWMANSEMTRNPEGWMIENAKSPRWSYTFGVVLKSMLDMWEYTGEQVYFDYVKNYADTILTADGEIKTYQFKSFNIDHINTGKVLFTLYRETGDEKYKTAIETLRQQMREHPRTSEGGFWHKLRYPHQLWLDGLYMATPFLAQYAREFNEPELFDDAAKQVHLIAKHTHDPATNLFYHAWDESREQLWANKETGKSPNFWGRSIGWFAMALVDVMDFLPADHSKRDEILGIIKNTADGTAKIQDEKSGVWYQVLDQGDREGNYLESSASSMFVYFLYKAVRKGYLDDSYLAVADKGYKGILENFIKENPDGTISLTNCCSVAGLGGNPYRDGSFEYYISEKVIDNDPKAIGPFIWASMEHEKAGRRKLAVGSKN